MKKRLLTLLTFVATSAVAQEYKPFKVNLSVGYAQAVGNGLSGGINFSVEPRMAVSPHTDLGFRMEGAYLVRGVTYTGNPNTTTGTVAGFGSYLGTATHFFGQGGTRPFLGLGGGIFTIASGGTVKVNSQGTTADLPVTQYTTIGGLLRAGLKAGHFVVCIDYNAIPVHVYKLTNTDVEFTSKSSYVGFKLGVDLGGGRR